MYRHTILLGAVLSACSSLAWTADTADSVVGNYTGIYKWTKGGSGTPALTCVITEDKKEGTYKAAYTASYQKKKHNYNCVLQCDAKTGVLSGVVKGHYHYAVEAFVDKKGVMRAKFFLLRGKKRTPHGHYTIARK